MSLKMLPKWWRLVFLNSSGQTLTFDSGASITIRSMPWEISSGALAYGTVITEGFFVSGQSIADDTFGVGASVDNSSNLYWGMSGSFEVVTDTDAADGFYKLYIEYSDTDGNWPSDAAAFVITDLIPIVTMTADNSAVDQKKIVNFEI